MIINPNDFTEKAQAILAGSQEIVKRLKHNQWDAEHLLLALLEDSNHLRVFLLINVILSSEHEVYAA